MNYSLEFYEDFVLKLASPQSTETQELQLMLGAIGLAGETGELIDHIKKVVYHGQELNKPHAIKEMGDCMWYLTFAVQSIGYHLSDIVSGQIKISGDVERINICCAAASLASRVGKYNDILEKTISNPPKENTPLDEGLLVQLKMIYMHLEFIASVIGITIQEAIDFNVEKLKDRYPDGVFDEMLAHAQGEPSE